jgi:hypothetical protein
MTDDRMSGLALIAGSVAGIITMSLHPTGHDLFAPGQLDPMARMLVAVHALALVSMPVSFLGALGLSRRLASPLESPLESPDRLAIAALVTYAFALLAVMNAAVADGLVAPAIARQMVAAAPSANEGWRLMFRYNFWQNQAFAQVFVVASSAAILLWSASILRSGALARGVGVYGCILGPLTLLAVFSGHLELTAHGFGLVIFGQALWLITVGALLCRVKSA